MNCNIADIRSIHIIMEGTVGGESGCDISDGHKG